MSKPILDKAEVAIDFPDKFYHGSFSRSSRYDVEIDDNGVHIALDREEGEKRHAAFHLHHQLFAGIIQTIAGQLGRKRNKVKLSDIDRDRLKESVAMLQKALD